MPIGEYSMFPVLRASGPHAATVAIDWRQGYGTADRKDAKTLLDRFESRARPRSKCRNDRPG
jgi:hypothetical protein